MVLESTLLSELGGTNNFVKQYLFGSRAYGTHTPNSDYDHITVLKNVIDIPHTIERGNQSYHIISINEWKLLIENHDVRAIEMIYLHNDIPTWFKLDKGKLRTSFSKVSSESWVKGKKKLIVPDDYNKYIAIKSIFHSIRIIDYGVQILTDGMISKPSRLKFIMDDLLRVSYKLEGANLWKEIDSKYRGVWKRSRNIFKKLAPKELTQTGSQKKDLIEVLKSHSINPSRILIKNILEIFE